MQLQRAMSLDFKYKRKRLLILKGLQKSKSDIQIDNLIKQCYQYYSLQSGEVLWELRESLHYKVCLQNQRSSRELLQWFFPVQKCNHFLFSSCNKYVFRVGCSVLTSFSSGEVDHISHTPTQGGHIIQAWSIFNNFISSKSRQNLT